MSENPYQSPNSIDFRLAEPPSHRSFRLTATAGDSKEAFQVGTFSDALRFSLIQQLPFLLFASMILDGGALFRCAAIAAIAFWFGIAIALFRRGTQCSDADILLIKWGFLPAFLIVYNGWQIAVRLL